MPFDDDKKYPTDRKCRKPNCDGSVYYEIWDSSDGAYTDYRYTCEKCSAVFWIDGIDS